MQSVLSALEAVVLLALLWVLAGGSAAAEPRPEPDPSFEPPWCGVGGVVAVRWEEIGGESPYTVTVEGLMTATTMASRIEVPCADIRARFVDGALLDHVDATLTLQVVDANGEEASREARLLLLASAPQREPPQAELIAGYAQLHVRPAPSRFVPASVDEPAPSVAIFRHRRVGELDWRYQMPFSRNYPSRYALPHVTELEPDTEYELQLAWLWHMNLPGDQVRCICWLNVDLRQAVEWWDQAGHDHWWRDWNNPSAIRWSAMRRFRTDDGHIPLTATGTADTIRVSWEAHGARYDVIVQSPDWPGVIWLDSGNLWARNVDDGVVTSTISGLPPDSEFEVQVNRVFRFGIADPPPTGIAVRTLPADTGAAIAPADPSDVSIALRYGKLHVQWRDRDSMHTSFDWAMHWPRAETASNWYERRLRGTSRLPDGRSEVALPALPLGASASLYLSRAPRLLTLPYVCAIWEVRSVSPTAGSDREQYLLEMWQVSVLSVTPGKIPDDLFELAYHCRLGPSTGE